MKVKKSTIHLALILIIVAIAGSIMITGESSAQQNNVPTSGDVQEITLSMKDYNYYPETFRVDAGSAVRINLDDSVIGCLRDFTVKDFGVHEYLETPQDFVEFTPTEKGSYSFACSMGMAYGTMVVE